MSVSSHLNPEPERRLWIIHESVLRSVEWADVKLGILCGFAALEAPLVFGAMGISLLGWAASLLLLAAVALALPAFSPLMETPRQLPLLDQTVGKFHHGDSFLQAADLARYPHMELVIRLDKYLGGGITATPYYEDIVAKIILVSRATVRKRRLFRAALAAAFAAQLALGAALVLR